MSRVNVNEYYSREEVKGEIAEFCRGRWAALEGLGSVGKRLFLRYWDLKRTTPLSITSSEDVEKVMRRFFWAKPRAFYASANLYSDLKDSTVLEEPNKLVGSTATWDIDGHPERYRDTLDVVSVLVEELGKLGIQKSVHILWSGRGAHVRVHEDAFSHELRTRYNPLDLAYALVEYVLRRLSSKLQVRLSRWPHVKVENLMDLKRVFTAPLSLHRELDLCAVCIKPNALWDFDMSWANPASPRHDTGWKEFVAGEADHAALAALEVIPGYFNMAGSVKTVIAIPGKHAETRRPTSVGRFQVMALLQAARYYLLHGDLDKAKSFGLNRAIFYAWAKRRGVGKKHPQPTLGAKEKPGAAVIYVGDEMAFISKDGWFEIGGQVQKPSDYDRQIVSRIEALVPYEQAWPKALNYVKNFNRHTLESQSRFYENVYSPVRDTFFEQV